MEVAHGEERRWAVRQGHAGEDCMVLEFVGGAGDGGVGVVGAGLPVPDMVLLLAAAFQPRKGHHRREKGFGGAGFVVHLPMKRRRNQEK